MTTTAVQPGPGEASGTGARPGAGQLGAVTHQLGRLAPIGPALAILALQLVVFPMPLGEFLRGVLVGGLTALIALGMALTYRSNRILNFAQADLGTAPAVLVYLLLVSWGWTYLLALAVGLAASLLLGALTEFIFIRRFFRAPRLLLTVATIGVAQLLAVAGILLPVLFDERILAPQIRPPFELRWEIGGTIFHANEVIAAIAIPVVGAALALFLRSSNVGVAIRASADNADRAALLGVPVKRMQTAVWAVAGLLGFIAIFLRGSVLGLPVVSALSLGILLRALAALLLGRLTNLGAVAASAVSLGVLELGVAWNKPEAGALWPPPVEPILAVVIAAALLLRRRSTSRTDLDDASTWQLAEEPRPVPARLARLAEVRVTRAALLVIGGALMLVLPHLLSTDRSLKASAVLIYALLGLSLVVLTGWSGMVSLGQVAFFALGAAVGGKATSDWGLDLTLAIVVAGVAGAAVAAIVALPAVRLRGFYLAVTTLAFALATTSWLLNPRYFRWVPDGRITRPPLLGQVDIDSPTRIYYVALAALLLGAIALHGIRRSRTGRALLALRDNERGAQAYGLSALRLKMTAFAISGGVAAVAGCVFVHHQQALGSQPYDPGQNFAVLTMVVIGGVGSLVGAPLGALYLQGTKWFLPTDWQFLATGFGVLVVLLVIPGGLGSVVFSLRDRWLRWVAGRHPVPAPAEAAA